MVSGSPESTWRLPDPQLIEAYKVGYVYTHIIKDGCDLNVGENGYDEVFDHDSIGILVTLMVLGDFAESQELLGRAQAVNGKMEETVQK